MRPIIRFLVIFVEIASKLQTFSLNFWSFNLFPPSPSVATNDRKQNKCHNIVLTNLDHYFWNSVGGKDIFKILKDAKIAWHSPLTLRNQLFSFSIRKYEQTRRLIYLLRISLFTIIKFCFTYFPFPCVSCFLHKTKISLGSTAMLCFIRISVERKQYSIFSIFLCCSDDGLTLKTSV